MGQTNNDCRFPITTLTSSLTPATFACWKIRFKTEVCTCSQFPHMIAQDATHEMRRSEAMRMVAVHGCTVAADRRAMSTASHCRQWKPEWVLVAGAQGWCGLGVCVLSEEPKPGQTRQSGYMRNCLHKCNRTQVRLASNEEADGTEIVTSLLANLKQFVKDARDTSPTSLKRGILRTMNPWLWRAMSWTFA